jgi:hypothetical protein
MTRRTIGPGDDVEAWCTRCRMNLNHRVIAVVGSLIQRAQCLTCGGDHKYYPPKYEKGERGQTVVVRGSASGKGSSKVSSGDRSRKSAPKTAERAAGEWTTFMQDLEEGSELRNYAASEAFRAGEFIRHPIFGEGKVLDIVGAEKMEVVFREGRKILLCNRAQSRSVATTG